MGKPKGKGKEQVETSDDISDTEPNWWSDEEGETSSAATETSSNVDVLQKLISHGFDVRGKLIEGKLQFIFRTPKHCCNGTPKDEGSNEGVRRVPRDHNNHATPVDRYEDLPAYSPPRPSYQNERTVHNGKEKPLIKRSKGTWLFT